MIFVIGFVGLFLFILVGGLIMGSNERNAAEEQIIAIKFTLDSLEIQSKKEYEAFETRVVRNAIQPLLNLGINFCDLTRTSSSLGICAYTQNRVYTSLSIESDADCKTEPIEYILGFQD